MKAIEAKGKVDRDGHLIIEEPVPLPEAANVRVIVLVSDDGDELGELGELDERAWLRAAAAGGGFEFLDDPAEDVYTPADGKPFNDARDDA
jgi:hypothetical protein